jgi:hypothetical protein
MKYQTLLFVFLVFAFAVSGCASAADTTSPTEGPSPQPVAVEDQASLVAALKAAGATVEAGEPITQEFFSPEATSSKSTAQMFRSSNMKAQKPWKMKLPKSPLMAVPLAHP